MTWSLEKKAEYQRAWKANHRESVREQERRYKMLNPEKVRRFRTNARFLKKFFVRIARSGGCVDCGEQDEAVLDFDHVNDDKVASVSSMAHHLAAWTLIVREVNKCEVRCANCHRRITTQRRAA